MAWRQNGWGADRAKPGRSVVRRKHQKKHKPTKNREAEKERQAILAEQRAMKHRAFEVRKALIRAHPLFRDPDPHRRDV